MRVKKSLVMQIKGIEWTIHLQSHSSYKRKHGSDSDAIMYPDLREIYYSKEMLIPRIVRHELMHAWVESSGIYCSNMKAGQMEELCSVIIGDHGPELFHQCDKIIEYFTRK